MTTTIFDAAFPNCSPSVRKLACIPDDECLPVRDDVSPGAEPGFWANTAFTGPKQALAAFQSEIDADHEKKERLKREEFIANHPGEGDDNDLSDWDDAARDSLATVMMALI